MTAVSADLSLDARSQSHDARLAERARKHGTPLYLYDLNYLDVRVAELRAALHDAQARLFFATMANDCLPVLCRLAQLGVGACVNSIPHLELAQEAGFASDSTQFTSTGVSRADLQTLAARGIRTNLDSCAQLDAWFELGQAEAGIRVNAASLAGSSQGDRIGIDADQLAEASQIAASRGGRINGMHVYVGTNFQRPQEMLPTLEALFDLAVSLPHLAYVNVGGGIGVDYAHTAGPFDIDGYGARIGELANRLRGRSERPVEVICEPGRALTASSARFLTSVTDVKQLSGRRLAAVDASVAIFPRPLHHPESPHRIRQLAPRPGPEDEAGRRGVPTSIVGRTTYSRDILGSCVLPEPLSVGALLCFEDAGAYCQSMISRFLGQPDPVEVFLDDGSAHRLSG
jgi:diaminopimelate decarboxylase